MKNNGTDLRIIRVISSLSNILIQQMLILQCNGIVYRHLNTSCLGISTSLTCVNRFTRSVIDDIQMCEQEAECRALYKKRYIDGSRVHQTCVCVSRPGMFITPPEWDGNMFLSTTMEQDNPGKPLALMPSLIKWVGVVPQGLVKSRSCKIRGYDIIIELLRSYLWNVKAVWKTKTDIRAWRHKKFEDVWQKLEPKWYSSCMQSFVSWYYYLLLGPTDVFLPMDVINTNTIPGTFVGHVEGASVLSPVRGVIGTAVQLFESTYINYGQSHSGTCFHNPDECNSGITFSMWLWLELAFKKEIIMKSKPATPMFIGYRLLYHPDEHTLRINIATNSTIYRNELFIDPHRWFYLSFTLVARDQHWSIC